MATSTLPDHTPHDLVAAYLQLLSDGKPDAAAILFEEIRQNREAQALLIDTLRM